jgi:membrane-associated protease RseP (regulator of RpoE activity)
LEPLDHPAPSVTVNYFPDFATIKGLVERRFLIIDSYIDVNGLPTFITPSGYVKQSFKQLLMDLSSYRLLAIIRREGDGLAIRVVPKRAQRASRISLNLILLVATIATTLYASYVWIYSTDPRLIDALFGELDLTFYVIMLAASIFGIIALHELGHLLASRFHGLDSSLPYFLPGWPFGTFGAVMSLKSIPANRDELFDIGFAGPVMGFIATMVVAIASLITAPVVPDAKIAELIAQGLVTYESWPQTPLLFSIIGMLGLREPPVGSQIVLTQIAFAAKIGALVTFLNILPIWQLDGGHIWRSVFGAQGLRIASFIGLGILVVMGYWVFALLLLMLMFGSRATISGVEPLDDISPLTNSRKLGFIASLVIMVLCFVVF